VGIETLIIFIAMILVAAVAAGVLINTAGFLQNKASSTSQDSENQVSNQVIVISATGTVNATYSPNQVNETTLTVMKSPGADEIDLGAATVEWVGPDGTTTLVYNTSGNNEAWINNTDGSFEFGVSSIKDDGGSVPVLTSKEDRFELAINHTGDAGLNFSKKGPNSTVLKPIEGGEEVTLRLVTQSGSQYVYILDVPESLSAKDSGEAVEM